MNRNAESMGVYGSDWQARGYAGQGSVSELIGSLAGRSAIVAGNAAGVFEEVQEATRLLDNPVVFACNDVGMYLPTLHHWVSLHSDFMGTWKAVRWQRSHNYEQTKYHAPDPRPYVDYAWVRLTPQFALSGYYAMQLAWIMGCERIVLCGCPGEYKKRFFEAIPRQDHGDRFGYGSGQHGSDDGVKQQLDSEMQRVPEFKAAVRSMSGLTRDYFGALEGVDDGCLCNIR